MRLLRALAAGLPQRRRDIDAELLQQIRAVKVRKLSNHAAVLDLDDVATGKIHPPVRRRDPSDFPSLGARKALPNHHRVATDDQLLYLDAPVGERVDVPLHRLSVGV